MPAADNDRIAARLDARLEELIQMRLAMQRAGEGMVESELAVLDNHPAEWATELHERELDVTTQLFLEEGERRISEARRALEAGTYGICVDCHQPIPADRLEAMPEAVRCLDCQRHFEGGHRQRLRI